MKVSKIWCHTLPKSRIYSQSMKPYILAEISFLSMGIFGATSSEGPVEERNEIKCMAILMSCVTNYCLLNNLVQYTLLHVKHWLHGEGYQHNVYVRKCITLTRQSLLLFCCPDYWCIGLVTSLYSRGHRHNFGICTPRFYTTSLDFMPVYGLLFYTECKYVLIQIIEDQSPHTCIYSIYSQDYNTG